jgi:hypothetical protein
MAQSRNLLSDTGRERMSRHKVFRLKRAQILALLRGNAAAIPQLWEHLAVSCQGLIDFVRQQR